MPIVDIMSGMYAAISVLAALARRAETGRGDYIDCEVIDVFDVEPQRLPRQPD